ncbi:MAG TPA: DUF4097 family beta strand repeat-containing protein [Thermoanaerobaculia bacterium]|jgi:DUF4097 and DUF4098 domain-containing protein YvlB|nr:DUF4097 family beta strand repeat-containing protein [Thermoanaerobaculia bacterium]
MRRSITLAAALLIAASAFAAEDVIRKGFNVSDGGTLRLDNAVGDIRVVTGGSGVAVEITRKARGSRGEERLRDHRINFEQRGNDVVITSDDHERRNRWFNWDDRYDVQWNIRVPDRYNLEVETSGGSIHIDDIDGNVEARTSGGGIKTGRMTRESTLKTSGGSISVAGGGARVIAHTSGGGITIGDTTGPVEAKTSGGSITLARVGGEVYARTSGGGITIEDATGKIDAHTSGGSIRATLSRQPADDSRLETSGGGVTVMLARSVAVDLDAESSGGGVHADIPVTVQGTQDDDSVRGRINGGGPKLVLRSSGGGIRVKGL